MKKYIMWITKLQRKKGMEAFRLRMLHKNWELHFFAYYFIIIIYYIQLLLFNKE